MVLNVIEAVVVLYFMKRNFVRYEEFLVKLYKVVAHPQFFVFVSATMVTVLFVAVVGPYSSFSVHKANAYLDVLAATRTTNSTMLNDTATTPGFVTNSTALNETAAVVPSDDPSRLELPRRFDSWLEQLAFCVEG